MKKKQMNGFTLVELLAVIVILAIILVIAVPKVMSVIKDSKKATIESTAKMIAGTAEKAKLQNQILGNNKEINCEDIAKINDVDYESCSIEFDGNTAKVTLVGSGKFEGLNVCNGTKTNSSGVNISCSEICDTNEEQKVYNVVKNEPYQVEDISSCVSVLTEGFTATGGADLVPMAEPICKGETVDGTDFNIAITMAIGGGLFTEEELIENDVIKQKETEEVKVCVPKEKMNGVTYLSNMVKDENARKAFGLIKDDTIDKNIRYAGKSPANKVYYNCEDKDSNNIAYGSENYDYASSCEVWRIIGVFNVQDGNGNIEKRMKIINTESTFEASWDSSASGTNSGYGINQWGESKYSNGDMYEGADLMRLLNGYYIGKSGSTCRYCNGWNQETCEQVCDTEENTLASQKMKPLTSIAKDQIDEVIWNTGEIEDNDEISRVSAYNQERSDAVGSNTIINYTITWKGKIGLIYASDVNYASTDRECSSNIAYNFACINNNWLSTFTKDFWTLSISSSTPFFAKWGYVKNNSSTSYENFIFPTAYLSSSVQIIGGDGNAEPFKLAV